MDTHEGPPWGSSRNPVSTKMDRVVAPAIGPPGLEPKLSLSQRGGHKPPNSSNLPPFTRLGALLLRLEGLHPGVCAPPRKSKSALERERPLAGVAGDSGDLGSKATSFAMRTADVHMETGRD